MSDTGYKRLDRNRPSSMAPQAGTLPPAGDARREELKRREDRLQEQAAATYANVEAIAPDAMAIERELAGAFNSLDVAAADPQFVYKWVNFVNNGGIALRTATAPPERWQIVSGDMPEAVDLRQVDGTRKLGDVILVRMPKQRYAILEKVRADKVARQGDSVVSELRNIAGKTGIKVHTAEDAPEAIQKRILHPSASAVNEMRGRIAAEKQFDTALREGSLSGV